MKLILIIVSLMFMSCASMKYIYLENPDNATKMGYEVTKIDTLGNGFYRVYYK